MKQSKKRLIKSADFRMLSKIQNYKSPKVINLLQTKEKTKSDNLYFVPPNSEFISSVIVNNKIW